MLTNFVFDLVAGASSTTKQLRRRILRLANYRFNVLISGPSGSGKRLLAEAIHRHSGRASGAFIPVNCQALSGPFFQSQMFGDASDSSHGLLAQSSAIGCFRSAEDGTLFLQNVDRLTLDEQLQLVDELKQKRGNVRVIASTSRDLDDEVRTGRFHPDLYRLLAATTIDCPSLSDRPDDIRPLASFFLAKSSIEYGVERPQISAAALALLESYDWPGNVREFQSAIDDAVRECDEEDSVIRLSHFSSIVEQLTEFPGDPISNAEPKPEPVNHIESIGSKPLVAESQAWPTLAETESLHIRQTLAQADYNARVAAKLLGLTFRAFQQKLTQHRLHGFLRAMANQRDAV
ncbi:sigma-54-dependent transcriptional regulator [Planctomycetota bacterium]